MLRGIDQHVREDVEMWGSGDGVVVDVYSWCLFSILFWRENKRGFESRLSHNSTFLPRIRGLASWNKKRQAQVSPDGRFPDAYQ